MYLSIYRSFVLTVFIQFGIFDHSLYNEENFFEILQTS